MSALHRKCEAPACAGRVDAFVVFEKPGHYAHALCFTHSMQLAQLAECRPPHELPTWWDAAEFFLSASPATPRNPRIAPRRADVDGAP